MRRLEIIGLGVVGSFLGVALLVGFAFYQDIFTVDRDGNVYFRITTDGRIGMPNTPDATALLDLSSTSKGFLMPRMTTAQRDLISSPATGLEIYNTTTGRVETYTGSSWVSRGISFIGARVRHSATQSIANATNTILTFDTELYDTDNIHSTVSNTSRLTCNTPGKYHIFANIEYDLNGTGIRTLVFLLNGSTIISYNPFTNLGAGETAAHSASTIYHLNAGDYIEVRTRQTSGGSLNVRSVAYYTPEFGMTLIEE